MAHASAQNQLMMSEDWGEIDQEHSCCCCPPHVRSPVRTFSSFLIFRCSVSFLLLKIAITTMMMIHLSWETIIQLGFIGLSCHFGFGLQLSKKSSITQCTASDQDPSKGVGKRWKWRQIPIEQPRDISVCQYLITSIAKVLDRFFVVRQYLKEMG